ncbi:glycerol-3-phosphate 1-O-acyltransferase PlsY [Marinilongibacter aquaticus]|uniref:glycerol-3-phosphate 1-O-acyltransferase PlsY n=1 Tax=Marinilongibacter aquaticus TaxID=2975157 RepID=UPI0021BD9F71|nr:glycerol-3-phosphate 1-O-acyltransferase PlsY [Marinilongibacter aquaticus]UBM57628.1 glycerol-3-phosphate 1-O-acyltransferase PlsY [Marinilongibacter aquaticus]
MLQFSLYLILAYLLGSIPSAVLYGRIFHGVDVREHGSGNAGATNSLRVLGKRAGLAVLIIDVLKGVLAVQIPHFFFTNEADTLIIFGFAAVIGHLLPVFANFRGGKGVATSFGIILALQPLAAVFVLVVFLAVVYTSKYVSLASLSASFSFLVYCFWQMPGQRFYHLMCLVLFLLLVFTHRQNIKRLVRGEENKYPPK